jgi:hypothetical protein
MTKSKKILAVAITAASLATTGAAFAGKGWHHHHHRLGHWYG